MKIINVDINDEIIFKNVVDVDTGVITGISSGVKLPTGNYNNIKLNFSFANQKLCEKFNIFASFKINKGTPIIQEIEPMTIGDITYENACNIPNEVFQDKCEVTLGVYGYRLNEDETLDKRFSLVPVRNFVVEGSYDPDATEGLVPTPTVFDIYFDKISKAEKELVELMEQTETAVDNKLNEIQTDYDTFKAEKEAEVDNFLNNAEGQFMETVQQLETDFEETQRLVGELETAVDEMGVKVDEAETKVDDMQTSLDNMQESIDRSNRYTILDNYSSESGTRKFILDNLDIPQKGDILKVWFDNKLVPKTIISGSINTGYDSLCCLGLRNGNVCITYKSDTSSVASRVAFVNKSGKVLKDIGLDSNYSARYVDMCQLKNGNIVMVYRTSSASPYPGYFSIFTENGAKVKSNVQVFNNEGSYSIIALPNGNFMIFTYHYWSSNDRRIYIHIYDENGNVVKAQTQLTSINGLPVPCLLKDGNIGAVYQSINDTRYVKFDIDGNILINPKIIESSAYHSVSCATTNSGNIFVSHSGGYSILSQDGDVIKNATSLQATTSVNKTSTILLKNGNIMVVYGYVGTIDVYTETGELVSGPVTISRYCTYAEISASLMKNGMVCIAYMDFPSSTSTSTKSVYMITALENGEISETFNAGITGNTINDIPVDTLLGNSFYELLYDDGEYYAEELRV